MYVQFIIFLFGVPVMFIREPLFLRTMDNPNLPTVDLSPTTHVCFITNVLSHDCMGYTEVPGYTHFCKMVIDRRIS